MTRKLFGTDGVRGRANTHPMTAEVAMRLGMAAACYLRNGGDRRHTVVIGKDTRLSGYMIENALTAGFTSAGMDVNLFGPVPTPAVATLTRSLRATRRPSSCWSPSTATAPRCRRRRGRF